MGIVSRLLNPIPSFTRILSSLDKFAALPPMDAEAGPPVANKRLRRSLCSGGIIVAKTSIVVVDDDANMGTYLCHLLSDTGYAVTALTNGTQLLNQLAAGPIPSLI